ncbi:ribosomal RNA small subunit methyltransferase D [Candidatus Photodesmus katoptron]|uniref:Ribosomal RNA small subunit methyltransferase D n=1 Tax=Candidatus Photodesmus katoptron Akat1 TaxID=1236703 RepID=S3EH39_9GAMM|nr:16S rRNA (guanine(966)-N(2))-methyltransferase RsmD [Candidatus Photodesmus katoptron]EPE37498.1 ribosomal RNA small subunit methyltransferase D [Candidatus Photodesmus katoptron Akat1]KEY90327.1 ribosomal RNA small subunit methyltransferase D [Candidatus Photodesmus katoptron]
MLKSYQKNVSKKKPGFIRIISGSLKGRRLIVHNIDGLRPTTDKVKETLFNWLAKYIYKAKCLDLFSGSGSLGFEAASRQAEKVVFVELNSIAFKQIRENIISLNGKNLSVINSDVFPYLNQKGTPYHIVFIDPPFRKKMINNTIKLLEENGWLTDNSMIYVESEKELILNFIPKYWNLYREKAVGQVICRLFKRKTD